MSRLRSASPGKDSQVPTQLKTKSSPWCSLPELYALVENFNKDSKKSSLLKTRSISPTEGQKLLAKSLSTMAFISRTGLRREDPQPVLPCSVVKRELEKPPPMAVRLYRSLLEGMLSPGAGLPRSQKRLIEEGISPPAHSFPYSVIQEGLEALAQITTEKTQIPQVLDSPRLLKLFFEDTVPRYFFVDPEKQFMDLRDLEWRYFKGLAKWKHMTVVSIMEIKYNSEKRFVESWNMPRAVSPPLVRKSSVIYPEIEYRKEGTCDLKWNI
ncbi:PREDICTED: uncharacterized protein C9orf153 homolog [Chinchilla lanigera]|uniref:Uncharacterized protein n=1 Tax=Chinchilla lanigera TaxID=34839 RepID=A0A8C2VA81_CHILA|nr:PREDICTED: uncharacterized protein C9orf153 homolog [Chinchilla lanigera]XP_005387975.1 PREDICTED: uncharacterized protein C9orf153 homolog [Chinchilla lanigera]XP_005387977.1 PREDICTED: uncharacterized protein C9orf153 homolog [Chinchilla lanigera]XP_013371403.1 PREDICTED: uncharacterized protein C9orf153 homolog [Chinchilla lanigera]